MIYNPALSGGEDLINGSTGEGSHVSLSHINAAIWPQEIIIGSWGANARLWSFGINESSRMVGHFHSYGRSPESQDSENEFLMPIPQMDYQDFVTFVNYNYWHLFHSDLISTGLIFPLSASTRMNWEMYLITAAVGNSIYRKIPIMPPFLYDYYNWTGNYLRTWVHSFDLEYIAYLNDVLHRENNSGD